MRIEDEIKSTFKSEYHKLLVNLKLTSSRLGEGMQVSMKEFGLTSTQFNVLRILRGQKQIPASVGLIKSRMIERNSDVSRIIDRLLKKEFIIRTENKLDRRQKDVIISDKGLSVLSQIDSKEDQIKELVGHLSKKEVQQLNELLDKCRK
jgi:DNA-binding MarR family transcriptional regulator